MRSFLIVIGAGFIAIAVYLVLQSNQAVDSPIDQTSGDTTASAQPVPDKPVDLSASDAEPEPYQPDRIVGEDRIPVPEITATSLQRLPPREPLSTEASRGSKKASGRQLLHRPIANAAGVIEAQGYLIRIAGIEPIPPEFKCQSEGAGARPCGKQALTAFRGWLRGRAIECDLGDGEQSDQILASCSLGGKDAGAWLVANGWAYATVGSDYLDLEAAAREKGLGVFAVTE